MSCSWCLFHPVPEAACPKRLQRSWNRRTGCRYNAPVPAFLYRSHFMTDRPSPKGRGSQINPPNRFEKLHYEADLEPFEHDEESQSNPPTEYFRDDSRSIVTKNDSPDVPFRYSINPYRGCSHGCSYCFARPTHEFLGLNAGLDFETKIFVKQSAPD